MNKRQFFTKHTWWGKILGGIFGYLTARSIGAFFGILIGNFFDKGLAEHFNNPQQEYHKEKRKSVQQAFITATFSIMGYIAKSDGVISAQEIVATKKIMEELELSYTQKELAKKCFIDGKQYDFNPQIIINKLLLNTRDNRNLLNMFLNLQYKAIMNGGFHTQKIKTLNFILQQLGFAPLNQQQAYNTNNKTNYKNSYSNNNQYQNYDPIDNSYKILNIKQTATKQEVKRAYRLLMSKHHPDKLMARGLSEKEIKTANTETQTIIKAYEKICQYKNW